MTPEATALAKRLVGLVELPWAVEMVTKNGKPWRYTDGTIGAADGDIPDLDHPSNLGHLCALADSVCRQEIGLVQDGDGGWLAVGKSGARGGDTRGQAVAAAIVAAKEQG